MQSFASFMGKGSGSQEQPPQAYGGGQMPQIPNLPGAMPQPMGSSPPGPQGPQGFHSPNFPEQQFQVGGGQGFPQAFQHVQASLSPQQQQQQLAASMMGAGMNRTPFGVAGQFVQTEAAAPPSAPVLFRVNKHCFSLPGAVVKADFFQGSALGVVVNGGSLPDGSTPPRTPQGEIILNGREPSNFSLMVDHLLGRKPLESYSFSSICNSYARMLEELDFWNLGRVPVELPIRLYTRSRWSDLAGFYALPKGKDADVLRLRPVAVQLDDGTVQSVRVLARLIPATPHPEQLSGAAFRLPATAQQGKPERFGHQSDSEEEEETEASSVVKTPDESQKNPQLDPSWTEACAILDDAMRMLPGDASPAQLVGLYHWNGYTVAMLDPSRRAPCPKALHALQNASLQQMQPGLKPSAYPAAATLEDAYCSRVTAAAMMAKFGNLGVAATAMGFAAAAASDPLSVAVVLVRLPHSDKVVSFELAAADRFPPPVNEPGVPPVFPFAFRRMERHYLWFSPSFGLEIQELRDGVTGVSKIRCCHAVFSSSAQKICSSLTTEYAVSNGQVTAHGAASGTWLGSSSSSSKKDSKPDAWSCYHPLTGTRYSDSTKWLREFGDVSKIRFYPWGTLFVHSWLGSPLAVLSVEQQELKRIYGERIMVTLKNFERLAREDMDIAATSSLDRVFLMAGGQVASQAITGAASKLEFEFNSAPRQKMKLVHVDIPDGAPTGKSIGSLQCLGILAEFDPSIGVYFQNEVSSLLCPKYTLVSSGH